MTRTEAERHYAEIRTIAMAIVDAMTAPRTEAIDAVRAQAVASLLNVAGRATSSELGATYWDGVKR